MEQSANEHLKILLVDDDSNEREGVRFLIEDKGLPLEIVEAPNGQKALEMIRRSHFDILFTDVKMPYMDGLELSSAVCKEFPSTQIIVFSAYGEFEYAKKAMEAKAVNYLLKPVEEEEFYKVLQAVISSSREKAAQRKQQAKRMISDQKLQWIHIITGKCKVNDQLTKALCTQGYPADQDMILLHIQTQAEFFAQHEQEFLKCLASHAPAQYEYVNVYPNTSYLVLFQDISQENLLKFCQKLTIFAEKCGEQCSFLISDTPCCLSRLSEQAKRLQVINRETILGENQILFLSELSELTKGRIAAVQQDLRKVEESLQTRSKAVIVKNVKELLSTMIDHHLFSTAYIHHIFCDLLGKMYTQFGVTDTEGFENAVRRLSGCHSRQSLLLLVISVLDEISAEQTAETDASFAVLKVKWIIQKEYGNDLSLEYLAGSVGLTPSYLSFVFKQETGENLVKYMTDYRMNIARKYLADGKLKVIQVARLCGYENQSYFNRLFKNTYGMTPKQYRERENE